MKIYPKSKRYKVRTRRHGYIRNTYRSSGTKWKKIKPTQKQQKALFEEYKDKEVSNIKITKKRISGKYDGKKFSYPLVPQKHQPEIGSWAHKLDSNEVYYDSDVRKEKVPGLLVHESVEQYLEKHKGLPYSKAHKLANLSEKKFVTKKGQSFRGNQISYFRTPL